MLGVDDRMITPGTLKWVRVGLFSGIAFIPTTIVLYYVLGLTVDAAWQNSNLVRQWLGVLTLLVVIRAVLTWIYRTAQFRSSGEAKINIRDQIYRQVVQLGPGILDKRRTGEIARTATDGVEYLDYYFAVYCIQIWVAIAIPVFVCAAIFWIDWVVGLCMLAGIPLTPWFVAWSAKGFRRISGQSADVAAQNSARYLDSIQGMGTIKMFNEEQRRGRQMEESNEVQRRTTMKLLAVAQIQFIPLELGFALFATAVAVAVSLYRYTGGHLTPGQAVAVVLLSLEFSRTLLLLGEFFFAGALGREMARKVTEFLNEKAPISLLPTARAGRTAKGGTRIELRDVSYTFPGADRPAISNLSMTLEPGETVALIGRSGSGKTTVTNLLLRTLEPQAGEILFDGVPEKELTLEWIREQIALVPQDPFMFFGTIAENLRMAKPDATDDELIEATKAAELYDFIRGAPDGLGTKVGDQGLALSGGQAQRLAIARALLKDAPIVILDEPTSQIDVETETLLNRALERVTRNKTVLLIAHRLSTIERANRIIVLEHGRLAETGTKQELLARGGIYAGMVRTKREVEAGGLRAATLHV